jgi:hypothetical protein
MPLKPLPDCQRTDPEDFPRVSPQWAEADPARKAETASNHSGGIGCARPAIRADRYLRSAFRLRQVIGWIFPEIKISRPEKSAQSENIGDDRARTGNLRRARAALSQLSYVPANHPLNSSGSTFFGSPPGDTSQTRAMTFGIRNRRFGRTWIRTTDLSFIRAAL